MMEFEAALAALRKQSYYIDQPDADFMDENSLLHFINRVGFCPLSPNRRFDLPNLCTFQRSEFRHHSDHIVAQRLAFYGRVFRRKSGFLALDMLPCLYRLSPAGTYQGDRFGLYQDHYLSETANRIAGIVAARGPLSTRDLRRAIGMASAPQKHRFWRILAEAQWRYTVVKTGVTLDEEHNYIYQWDSFERVYQEYAVEGLAMDSLEAGMRIVERFINTTIASTSNMIARLFFLNEQFVEYTAQKLAADNRLRELSVNGSMFWVSLDHFDELMETI
jgi:hypothetical protein